jgi:hypothetical protein
MSTKLPFRALFCLVVICTTWIVGCTEDKPAAPSTPPAAGGAPPPADTTKPAP